VKGFKLKVESLTVQVFAVGLAIIGIMLGLYCLGFFGQASLEPYLLAVLMFIYGGACLSESIWEEGIKSVSDLKPLDIAGIILGILAIIIGILNLPFVGFSITALAMGERLMGAVSILFFGLSVFIVLELFE
jgi:small-conductance mechanosensitive channel